MKLRCLFMFHDYRLIGHLYENWIPGPGMAIYKECKDCGHVALVAASVVNRKTTPTAYLKQWEVT